MKGDGNTKLGDYLKTRRTSQGLDIRTLAERSGFHESYWRKLEAGHYRSPDAKHLKVIADVLDCPLEDLYSLAGYTTADELPTLRPYLRTKYDLPREAAAELERYFEYLRSYYGLAQGETVFPKRPAAAPRSQPRREPPTGRAS